MGGGAETRTFMVNSYLTSEEEEEEIAIRTRTGQHRIPFEEHFKILGFSFNQAEKTQDSLEERKQNANKAWWRDVKLYRSEAVPWRVKCRRRVEHVCSVLLPLGANIGPGVQPLRTELKHGKRSR